MVTDTDKQSSNLTRPKRRKLAEKMTSFLSCFACRTRKSTAVKRDFLHEVGIENEGNDDVMPELEDDTSDDEFQEETCPRTRPVSSASTGSVINNRISTLSADSSTSIRTVDTYIRTDGVFHLMGMSVRGGVPGSNRNSVGSNTSLNIRIHRILPGSFAHGFGLKENDVICAVNNAKVVDLQCVLNELISKDSSKLQVEIKREVSFRHSGEFQTKSVTAVLKHHTSLVLEQAEEESGIPHTQDVPSEETDEAEDDTKLLVRLHSEAVYIKFSKKWIFIDEEKRHLLIDGHKKKEKSLFVLHSYTDIGNEENTIPVLLQHLQTKLCVAIIKGTVIMRDPPSDLHVIHSDNPSLLRLHNLPSITQDSAENVRTCSFESALDDQTGWFVGFKAGAKMATPIQGNPQGESQDTEENQHEIEDLSLKDEFVSLVRFQMVEVNQES